MEYIAQLNNISKKFPGVVALDDVSFQLKKGEVHILLGENGAGKSTLIKILSGVYLKDKGQIIINGEKCEFKFPSDASRAGVATIYQEFNLIDTMSVAENIFMGRLPSRGKVIELVKKKELFDNAKKVLNELNMNIDPRKKVGEFGVAEKQMVEIAKAISVDSKILIMDEPTAVLTDTERDELFRIIREMRERGIGIIYISHRLEEIKEIGDRVTVLRDGKYIDTLPAQTTDLDILIKLMIGRELKEKFPGRDTKIGDVALEVKNLNTDGKLKNINFKVHRGEVLGVAGLVGSGRSEVVRAVFGADKSYKEIYKDGKMITINKPIDAIRNGIALLTEERKKDGLVLKAQVRENITMVSYKDFTVGPFIRIKEQNRVSRDYIKKLNIRTPSVFTTTENLSGGNQQKTVIAKWLCAQADIFFFDEPTRGIDVGTKLEVYNLINELVENGAAVIMISSEMPEVLGMSDRIMVMANGEIVGEFPREKANQENILNLCFKQTKNREENKIG